MSETQLVASIRQRLALEADVLMWRNNTGRLQDARRRWVTYGLGIGGADLVGMVSGRFFAIEAKAPKGVATAEQHAWANVVRAHGGFCATVRSVEEALAALERCRRGESR